MWITVKYFSIVALIFAADTALSDVFEEGIFFPTAGAPSAVVTADLDGSSGIDIATASNETGTLSILLSDGFGGYAPPVEYGVSAPSNIRFDLCVADFDNDDDLDLAVLGLLLISIHENDGTGTFTPAGTIETVYVADQDICVGDLNGDQQVDLLYSQRNFGGNLWLLTNTGSLTFADPVEVYSSRCWQPSCAHIDEDPHLDVVFHRWSLTECVVLSGNGDGTFQEPQFFTVEPADYPLTGMTLGDADSDGDVDIFVSEHTSSPGLHLLLNDGFGEFSASSQIHSYASYYVRELAVAQFDGEGCLDVANVSVEPWSEITLNDCAGTFTPEYLDPFPGAQDLCVSDLNLDGATDMVHACSEADSVLVWYNTVVPTAPVLSITYVDEEITLSWTDIGYDQWEVYRLSNPYDNITEGELLATVSEESYVDLVAMQHPTCFYTVRGISE
jgi:hypothetical protein